MPTEIKNAVITHVSLVSKGANKRSFSIVKSAHEPQITKETRILKIDEEKRLVTGVVYEPNVLDTQEEFMTAEEIEKSALLFMDDYGNIDKGHNFISGYGKVMENWITKAETDIGGEIVPQGTWVMTVKVTDDATWESVKKGEITGFSMGGSGERVPVPESESTLLAKIGTAISTAIEKGFGLISKGELRDQFNATHVKRNMRAAFSMLDDIFWEESYAQTPNLQRISTAANDLVAITHELVTTGAVLKSDDIPPLEFVIERATSVIEKAGKKIATGRLTQIKEAHEKLAAVIAEVEAAPTEGEIEVKKEDLEQILKEAISPITERLDKIEKEQAGETEPPGGNEGTQGDASSEKDGEITKEWITELIQKELSGVNTRIEQIEIAKGVRKSINGQDESGGTVQKSVWADLDL
jgi:hypothetical protein